MDNITPDNQPVPVQPANTTIQPVQPANNRQPAILPCPDLPVTHIFNQPEFKYRTKPYSCKPYQVRQLLDYWACSGDNLRVACAKYGIGYEVIRELQHEFSDINAYHARTQEAKADVYFENALEAACDDRDDLVEVTKVCKNGDTLTYQQGNMVNVRRKELITHSYFAAAERLSARYRQKSEVTTKNLNFNVQGPPIDLLNANIQDLS